MNTLTYLQEGMLIKLGGVTYEVDMVNDCRARCRPTEKVTVKRKMFDKRSGQEKEIEFSHTAAVINISPNSECEILGHIKREKKPETFSLKILTKPVQDIPEPLKVVEVPPKRRSKKKRSRRLKRAA